MPSEPWFYVEDGKLPEVGEEVFVWDVLGKPNMCRAIFKEGKFFGASINMAFESVIAWMPMAPEPRRWKLRRVLDDVHDVRTA